MAKFPKEKSPYLPLLYIIFILSGFLVGAIIGISADNAEDENGKIDFKKMAMPDISFSILKDSLRDKESNAIKIGFVGGFAVFLAIAHVTSSKKRYHRKGEEHGSAQWGTSAEKRKLADRGIVVGIKKVWQWLLIPHRVEAEIRVPYQVYSMLSPDFKGEVKIVTNAGSKNKKNKSLDNQITERTTNTVVVGSAGTGKSHYYVNPKQFEANAPYLITNPKGDVKIVSDTVNNKNSEVKGNVRNTDKKAKKDKV
jgi:type IV secretion system protein VirD4